MQADSLGGGRSLYPIDDTYIHLAMARNLAQHGVWGITRYAFSSTSSSLLWTLLLAAIATVWPTPTLAPLLLNVLLGAGMLLWLVTVLSRVSGRYWLGALAGGVMVVILPLPVIAYNGMEHLLHAWLTLGLLWVGGRELAADRPTPWRLWWLGALSLLVVMARFEGLFLVGLLALLFALRRRWAEAGTVLGAGVLPVVAFAVVSRHFGAMILPNSVLLKGSTPQGGALGYLAHLGRQELAQLRSLKHLTAMVGLGIVLVGLAWHRRERFWSLSILLPLLAVALIMAHLAFASRGARYEAYLGALGVLGLTLGAWGLSRHSRPAMRGLIVALALLAALPWLPRAAQLTLDLPPSCINIYQQQCQMGLFLRAHYQGVTVVANDIGAINYLADIRCFDWWGLGTIEVARARLAGQYDPAVLERLARASGARIAVVYDDWLKDYVGGVPDSWQPVGRWTIPQNVICAYPTVTFHALDPEEAPRLRRCLTDFPLPRSVQREIIADKAAAPSGTR